MSPTFIYINLHGKKILKVVYFDILFLIVIV